MSGRALWTGSLRKREKASVSSCSPSSMATYACNTFRFSACLSFGMSWSLIISFWQAKHTQSTFGDDQKERHRIGWHLLPQIVVETRGPLAAAQARGVAAVVHHERHAPRMHVRIERVHRLLVWSTPQCAIILLRSTSPHLQGVQTPLGQWLRSYFESTRQGHRTLP